MGDGRSSEHPNNDGKIPIKLMFTYQRIRVLREWADGLARRPENWSLDSSKPPFYFTSGASLAICAQSDSAAAKVHVILPSDTARSDLRNFKIVWFSVPIARFYLSKRRLRFIHKGDRDRGDTLIDELLRSGLPFLNRSIVGGLRRVRTAGGKKECRR